MDLSRLQPGGQAPSDPGGSTLREVFAGTLRPPVPPTCVDLAPAGSS
ncbi:hypothetical protein GS506_15715 [Rhodococcus hoagii]|nr:hypothetical protein [Prescottella equi]